MRKPTVSSLAINAFATTYEDVEPLIRSTVRRFVRRYGGSFDQCMEHASLIYVKAYRRFDPSQAKFSTYLVNAIWYELLEVRRRYACKHRDTTFVDADIDILAAPARFDLAAFIEELSDDARQVVKIVFETAWQFEPSPYEIRRHIVAYLSQPAIGWTSKHIKRTFAEIRDALGGGL